MALNPKQIFIEFMQLPGTILNGLAQLAFGYTEIRKNGKPRLDKKTNEPIVQDGFLSLLLKGVSAVGRGIANFVNRHITEISVGFWTSLIVGGAIALTLFFWPAALSAVAGFSVYGLSIAGIVGANPLLQIGLAAGLGFAATSLATYLAATVVNAFILIRKACWPHLLEEDPNTSDEASEESSHSPKDSPQIIGSLLGSSTLENNEKIEIVPIQTDLLKPPVKEKEAEQNLVVETPLKCN